jgi:hypothetical protein
MESPGEARGLPAVTLPPAVEQRAWGTCGVRAGSRPPARQDHTLGCAPDSPPAHLSGMTGDADLVTRLVQLARRYPDLTPEERTVARHLFGMWVKDD